MPTMGRKLSAYFRRHEWVPVSTAQLEGGNGGADSIGRCALSVSFGAMTHLRFAWGTLAVVEHAW